MSKECSIFAESWNIAWRKKEIGSILEDKKTCFNIIKNSIFYWAADPFVFEYNGEVYIFAELYDYIKRRGTLGYCKLNSKKKVKWKKIISEEYHLSYPYIYEENGNIYILPESSGCDELYVYKAICFPNKWKKERIIRNHKKYADTTPLIPNNQNLLLSYCLNDKNTYNLELIDLFDFNNDKILEEDYLQMKRPAGKNFYYNEKIIRPAQICKNSYGEGLVFYEYVINQYREYSEKIIEKIYPYDLTFNRNMYTEGIHTYGGNDEYEIIDIKTKRFNIINFLCRLIGKIKG